VELLFDDGWHMTPEEWGKIKSGDPVLIHQDSGECRPARFETGAKHFSAKVIFEGETKLSSVAARKIGPVELTHLVIHVYGAISDIEKQQEVELETLCRQITEEDPGYFDRLADRIVVELVCATIVIVIAVARLE
jgi:hypothetical protein